MPRWSRPARTRAATPSCARRPSSPCPAPGPMSGHRSSPSRPAPTARPASSARCSPRSHAAARLWPSSTPCRSSPRRRRCTSSSARTGPGRPSVSRGGVRNRCAGAVLVMALAATGLAPLALAAPAAAAPATADRRLFMVGDSVLLSAQAALVQTFAGYQLTIAGHPAIFTEDAAALVPASAASIGAVAVVATGYNYPYWDPARFDRSVDLMVANLERAGAKRVIWVTLREVKPQFVSPGAWAQIQPYSWYFPTVNEHLRAAQARHPDLVLADWAAVADRTGITYDAIHLNTAGGALMADLIQSEVEGVTRLRAGSELTVPVAGTKGVAADAGGVALNVTVTDPRADGFVTVHPCGETRPLASNVNFVRGQTVANHVLTKPGAGGAACVYTSTDAHVVVDLDGWAQAGAGLAGPSPERLLDTRETHTRVAPGAPVTFRAKGGPTGAAAVVDVAAVAPDEAGFLTVAPCGPAPPLASSVNFAAGQTIANLAVVPLGSDGTACVTSNTGADVVVDLVGWAASGITVGTARRVLDTRATGGRATAGGVAGGGGPGAPGGGGGRGAGGRGRGGGGRPFA